MKKKNEHKEDKINQKSDCMNDEKEEKEKEKEKEKDKEMEMEMENDENSNIMEIVDNNDNSDGDFDENYEKELTQTIEKAERYLKKMKEKLQLIKNRKILGRKTKHKDEK